MRRKKREGWVTEKSENQWGRLRMKPNYTNPKDQMTLNFSTATLEARQQWNNAFKLHKKIIYLLDFLNYTGDSSIC